MPTNLIYPDFQTFAEDGDARLDAPAFHRNIAPVVEALTPRLGADAGDIFELGAGSGQHAVVLAQTFPALTFWPSDPDPARCASIDAWVKRTNVPNIRPAIAFDATSPTWPAIDNHKAAAFRAALAINVIHIAPWAVAQGMFRGAAAGLARNGFFALYGPFRFHGQHIADSNAAFDQSLRDENPDWGVRDIDDIDTLAHTHGLTRSATIALPANNHMLVFEKRE